MATTNTERKQRASRLPSEVRLDSAGRLNLGKGLGGRLFKVVAEGDEIRLVPARVVTDREAWFFENQQRVQAMDRSVNQANEGKLEEITAEGIADL